MAKIVDCGSDLKNRTWDIEMNEVRSRAETSNDRKEEMLIFQCFPKVMV
jgi:hypothetical protein